MELLKKTIQDDHNPRNDNVDKKELFPEGKRPRTAAQYKEEWSFIEDQHIRENIAYQMQFLEFQIRLYNDYRIYLTVESLLAKNIMAIIGGVVESALYGIMNQEALRAGQHFDERMPYLKLIDTAYDMGIIDADLKDTFHSLRKMRNLVHLNSIEYREYQAYDVDEANEYIEALQKFIDRNREPS